MKRSRYIADITYVSRWNSDQVMNATIAFTSPRIHLPTIPLMEEIKKYYNRTDSEHYLRSITNVRKIG